MSEDYLSMIMEMQNKLNSAVGISKEKASEMDDETLSKWIQRYNGALSAEVSEIWEASRGRWWRNYSDTWKSETKEEAVDALHFLLSIFLLLGMDAKQVFDTYYNKNKKNLEREDWHHHPIENEVNTHA